MYNELRSSILSKDHESVRRICEQAHALNYTKESTSISSLSLWVEAISLVYLSFIDETDTKYRECVEHINHAFDLNLIVEEKQISRLLSLRLRCYEELFHCGVTTYNEQVAKDRQVLLGEVTSSLLTYESNEVDIVNTLNMFVTSSTIDLLQNANDDSVYSFLVSQNLIAYKILKAIYIERNNLEQIKRIEQCLTATYTNLSNRVNGLEKLCESERRRLNNMSPSGLNPSWDIVSLGLELPEL